MSENTYSPYLYCSCSYPFFLFLLIWSRLLLLCIVCLFLFVHFVVEYFVFSLLICRRSWFIMDFNPLTGNCVATIDSSLLLAFYLCPWYFTKSFWWGTTRKFISDFYSRENWVSSRRLFLVFFFPCLWIHVTVFPFSHFSCQKSQNKLFYSLLATVWSFRAGTW